MSCEWMERSFISLLRHLVWLKKKTSRLFFSSEHDAPCPASVRGSMLSAPQIGPRCPLLWSGTFPGWLTIDCRDGCEFFRTEHVQGVFSLNDCTELRSCGYLPASNWRSFRKNVTPSFPNSLWCTNELGELEKSAIAPQWNRIHEFAHSEIGRRSSSSSQSYRPLSWTSTAKRRAKKTKRGLGGRRMSVFWEIQRMAQKTRQDWE